MVEDDQNAKQRWQAARGTGEGGDDHSKQGGFGEEQNMKS